jgi:hypothetical protein
MCNLRTPLVANCILRQFERNFFIYCLLVWISQKAKLERPTWEKVREGKVEVSWKNIQTEPQKGKRSPQAPYGWLTGRGRSRILVHLNIYIRN